MGAHPTLLFTGASGLVGASLYRSLAADDRAALAKWRVVLAVHRRAAPAPLRRGDRVVRADLAEPGAGRRLVEQVEPQAVMNLAAHASLPACEAQPQLARRLNADAAAELARAASEAGAFLMHLSTDQVFDGGRECDAAGGGYREDDEARPITVYGATKLAAERAILAGAEADALVLRTALVLAPSADGRTGPLDSIRRAAADGAGEVRLFTDEWRTPVSVVDLARVVDEALRRRATGLLHVAGPERLSRFELGERIAAAFPPPAGAAAPRRIPAAQREAGHRRPRDVSLATERLRREGWPRPEPLAAALIRLASLTGAAPRA